jgi:hypothetical protein
VIPLAITAESWGWIALAIGLVAALVVAALLVALLVHTAKIRGSVDNLLETAGEVGANTAHIPQLEATAPVLAEIFDEAAVQDGYMNALTDGFGPLPEEAAEGNGGAAAASADADPGAAADEVEAS